MKFIELTVHTASEGSELVADAMWEHTPHGVTVCDANDIIALQKDSTVFWDYMDENLAPERDVLVKCYFEPEVADGEISALMRELVERKELAGGAIDFGTLESARREIEGDDWIDVWKSHFRPLHIGERVVVVPAWIDYTVEAGEIVVTLDSNMAFGTGEHETTSMCLEFLQDVLKEGDVVIDVGCGSGILGIAAAKLGAGLCYLTDLDPVAVESAKHNAQKNGVQNCIVAHSDLLADSSVKGDVVLANITADVLARLAPSVPANLKAGGTLILSGIICERLDFVKEKYAAAGFTVEEERRKGEWYALVLRKR